MTGANVPFPDMLLGALLGLCLWALHAEHRTLWATALGSACDELLGDALRGVGHTVKFMAGAVPGVGPVAGACIGGLGGAIHSSQNRTLMT